MHRKLVLYVCIVNTLYMACLICMHRKHIIYGLSYMYACMHIYGLSHYIWLVLYVCIVNTLYMACLICMHRKHIIYGLSYMYAS